MDKFSRDQDSGLVQAEVNQEIALIRQGLKTPRAAAIAG